MAQGFSPVIRRLAGSPTRQPRWGALADINGKLRDYAPSALAAELAFYREITARLRVRVDVGIHTGRMSFDEAVDYFNEHVDFYPRVCARAASDQDAAALCDTAQRAIYRYSKWPTQAMTYNLGKNAIVELREDSRAKLGAAFSAKAFHEKFMRMGTVPVGYFEDDFLK